MVHLEAADLDGKADNKDELIVTVSLGNLYNESGIKERGSVVMVLSKSSGSWETVWSYQFSHVYAGNQPDNKYDAGWHLRAAASRAEDIDHDGAMEIVTAGVGADDNNVDDNFHDEGYFVVITQYNGNSYQVETSEQTHDNKTVSCQSGFYVKQDGDNNENWVGEQDPYLQYMNPCSLGIVRFDGRGTVPYIVIRGQIFKYNSNGTLDGANTKTDGLDNVLNSRKIINQPIVGNFDGNAAGREQILFTISSGDGSAVNIGGYYYKPTDYQNSKATGLYQSTGAGKNVMNDTENGLRSCRWGMNAWGIAEIALAAPDIDSDGIIADYQGKEYAYNDPQVLAVMEAPPYFEDIEYSNAGETAISFSKGSGSSTGTSTANRIGTYVSFSQDFSVGGIVDLGGFEFETAFEAEWNNSIEIEQSFTMTNGFSTEQAESAVVLICIPVTIYHYNTTSADGSKSTMDITVANAPTYKTIPLSEYNAAAKQRGDPEIGSDIIASTAGQPSTYRSTTTGLKNAVTTSKGTNGGWFDTAAGESSKSQSVAFETSKTTTKELTFNIDAKGGGGLGGFKFGLSGGSSSGSSASSISTEGIERSGTVHDLPSGTTDYSFQWQFVGWETTLTTGGLSYNVPVLSYLVQNVKQPPSKPQNLEAKEVGTDHVTLEWESGFTTAAQYQVYRYMPNNTAGEKYALLGTVSGLAAENGKYTLTDTEVQPSTQYQYVLKSVGTDGRSTDYTDPLAVTTLATGYKPNITKQPVPTSVRPGTDAVFTISATPTGGARSVTYRWQSRTDGGRWTDLNETGDRLTIEKPAKSMSGTEYRCIVSQTNMKTEKSAVVYSDTVKLTVGKASSETTLTTSGTGGTATHETTGTATKTVTAQYNISGKTYQKFNNAYTGTNALTDVYGASDSTGYHYYEMKPTLNPTTPDADGVYTGTVDTTEELKAAADRVKLNETVYEIGSSGFQKTQQTINISGAEGTEYKVYTAIGVAGTAGTPDTLTLYLGADNKYYRKDGDNPPVEMKAADTISDEDTNTYRTNSLTPVYVTENGYTVLTYTTEESKTLNIYELNGTYYSKNDNTYTSLHLVTGLYQDKAGKLFKPGAAETTQITVSGSKEQVKGEPVTLTANVDVPDKGAATNGTVTFEITNTTTGNVTRYPVSKSSDNSEVTCAWTPSEAGVYSIVANFGGNSETAASRSTPVTYYAKAAEDLYEIAVSDCTYGDTIAPSLKAVKIEGTSGSASGADKNVTYAAYKDGSSTAVADWPSSGTLVPGTYRITATADNKVLASKYITVSRKPITITAPSTGNSITFDSFVDGDHDTYASLFKLEGLPTDNTAGVYNVSVVYNEDANDFTDKQAEFFSKYTPTLKNSMVLVQADTFTVTYSNGNNGTLKGHQGGNSTFFESGAEITSGSNVTFTATPTANYQVWKWTVNGEEVTASTDGYTLSPDKTTLTISKLNADLKVQVEFSNQFYTVSAQSGENGSVTATVNGSPTLGSVLSGTEVTFTAKPEDRYVVKQWTITRDGKTETQTNADGSIFSGKELKLTITANTTVNVTFEPTDQFTVTYSAVKQEDYTSVPLDFETTGLTDGKGEKGSTVTLTAKPPHTMGIAGWQYKTSENGTWIDSTVTGPNYTIQNLQSNIWVRALVNDSAAPTKVNFGVVDETGAAVTNGGTLTAKYAANGAEITNDTYCTTYSTITFTYTEPTAYEVVGWKVNGRDVETVRNGKTFTYTINSLTTETTVNMVVRAKPTVAITSSTPPENCTFSVTYKLNGETVTPEEADGKKYVYSGTMATATATPSDNYVATDVKAVWTKGEQTGNSGTPNPNKANGVQKVENVEINADTTFSATFVEKPKVTIETATGGTVTVTVNGEEKKLTTGEYVDFGTDLTVTLAPDKGYEVGDITGAIPQYTDGTGTTTDDKSYTISNVQNDQTITPVWSAIPTTTVNWSVIDKTPNTDGGTDGTLKATVTRKGMDSYAVTNSTDGTLTVYRDSAVTFTATPDTGYKTGVWQLNGEKQDSKPTLTITKDTASPQTVEVQFDPLGDKVTYGFQKDSADAAAHKAQLTAQFKPNSGTEGKFESGTTPATDGSITFTVSGLDAGYEVEGWYVDGNQSGETGTTFTHKVTHNVGMDVQVKIVRKSYQVNFSATNGTVTAMANDEPLATGKSVVGDTSVTFTAKPQSTTGYTFDGWTVNGEKREGTDATLTLDITEDTTVSAAYTLNTVSYAVNYGVTSVTSENGTLTATNGTNPFDSGTAQPAGSTIVFTAQPEAGYQVKGWYTAADGTTAIPGTTSEQNSYTMTNLTNAADVYVAFEPIPTYDITVNTTGRGHVTATINNKSVEITGSKLTVSRHANVVLTAVPDANQYLTGWMLDNQGKGNSSLSLTLDNVTDGHAVKADFAASQLVTLKTVCGANGRLTAQAGYGDKLETINASSESGIQVEKGKKVVLTVTPGTDYMVKQWTVNDTVQDNLSNTLTIENLSENTTVAVAFEKPLTLYSIPQSDTDKGYIVTDVKKTPNDYGNEKQIRARGTVTFTVAPVPGQYLTALKVNDKNCLGTISNAGDENKLTVVNKNGSYTITVANVTQNITLEAASMQFRTIPNDLTVPDNLKKKYPDANTLKTELRTQVKKVNASVPESNVQYYDIKLQYTEDGGNTWKDATEEHFPAGGITVQIPYSKLKSGLDNSYTYTVIHMFTTGDKAGTTESITPTKGADDITFTVKSLSPFAIGWYKAPSNPGGGGGGGGGGAAVSTYVLTFETNGGSAIAQVTKDSGTTVDLAAYQPTRAGYTFAGWFSDKELTKPVTSVKLTANTMVYAKWSQGGESQNPFTDVKKGEFYYDAVLWAVDQKITSGTSATTFSPAASCTRAQMVTFLWRAAGSPKVEDVSDPFTDVKPGAYYYDAVLWAVKNGVTSGTSATTFSPDDTVTRGQTVTFLYRNAGTPDVTGTMPFTDVKADAYYAKAVLWAVEQEITNGTSKDQFTPEADCTRGQIVTFLYRANQK